jgi:hypothetical protein
LYHIWASAKASAKVLSLYRLKELTCGNWFAGQLKDATSEQIKHGGCLGLGLAAMGTHRADVYEQLKFCLYQVPYLAFNRSLQYLQIVFSQAGNRSLLRP